jgi:hypothetical protein
MVSGAAMLVGSVGGGVLGNVDLAWPFLARAALLAAGYVAGGLTMLLAVPPLLLLRRMGQPADRIVGRKAGTNAPCAAQGLPQVASVDTTVRQSVRSGGG